MTQMTQMIPAAFVRSALLAAATKDVRYYLNGVFFDTLTRRIVGTDGTMIYCAKNVDLSHTFDKPTILEHFKVPVNAEHITIERLKDDRYEVVCYQLSGKTTPSQLVKSIDGSYPNYVQALAGTDIAATGESIMTAMTFSEQAEYAETLTLAEGEARPLSRLMPLAKDAGLDLRLLARAAKIIPLARLDFSGRERITFLTSNNQPDEIVGIMPLHNMGAPEALEGWHAELSKA